nr:hypothetical protein 13 [bacterium]
MAKKNANFSFKHMIYYLYGDTLLPEIYEELGEKNTLKLVSIFGGVKLTIPSYTRIKELQRNVDIYETLCHAQSVETIRLLADKYEVSRVWIRSIFNRMRREYPRIVDFIERMDPDIVTISTKRNLVHAKSNKKEKGRIDRC